MPRTADSAALFAQANPAIVEEAGERVGPLEHVGKCLGDLIVARQPGAFTCHPVDEFADSDRNPSVAIRWHGEWSRWLMHRNKKAGSMRSLIGAVCAGSFGQPRLPKALNQFQV
jgi:hypothetical protein